LRKISPYAEYDKAGYWVIRRFGYNEDENPNHMVAIMCGSTSLGCFPPCVEPTALEILDQVLQLTKQRKRPFCWALTTRIVSNASSFY
jgi:hypothetical protein